MEKSTLYSMTSRYPTVGVFWILQFPMPVSTVKSQDWDYLSVDDALRRRKLDKESGQYVEETDLKLMGIRGELLEFSCRYLMYNLLVHIVLSTGVCSGECYLVLMSRISVPYRIGSYIVCLLGRTIPKMRKRDLMLSPVDRRFCWSSDSPKNFPHQCKSLSPYQPPKQQRDNHQTTAKMAATTKLWGGRFTGTKCPVPIDMLTCLFRRYRPFNDRVQ